MFSKLLSCLFLTAFLCGISLLAFAKDGWEGRPHVCDMPPGPRLVQCQQWIESVKRPDIREARCCGDGDAYIVDNFRLDKDGELFVQITGTYYNPDGSVFLADGEEMLVPKNKINTSQDDAGNTSGHGVLFLNNYTKEILCMFFPPLT